MKLRVLDIVWSALPQNTDYLRAREMFRTVNFGT